MNGHSTKENCKIETVDPHTNYPDPYLLLVGAAISAFGLGVGKGISVLKRRKKEN